MDWNQRKAKEDGRMKDTRMEVMAVGMNGNKEVKVPEDIRQSWDEIRMCAALLRQGKARIVTAARKDGTRYRYTEIR